MISIDNSSEPFRALLGAILSIVKKVPVEPTEFNPNIELDTIVEEDKGPLPQDDIDDGSALMVCPCLPSLVISLAHLLLDHRIFPKFA